MRLGPLCALALILFCQNGFAGIDEILPRLCRLNLSSSSRRQDLKEKESLEREIASLDKGNLTAGQRKQLFRAIMSNRLYVQDDVIDDILGMKYREVSTAIYQSLFADKSRFGDEIVWAGPKSMATYPFSEFDRMWRDVPLKKGNTVVDIGAGFGRLGLYLGIMFPGVKFIGYEIVPERVQEFTRVASALELDPEVKMIEQDLSDPDFSLALADYYYSYNPVNKPTGQKLWADLLEKAKTHAYSYHFHGLEGGRPWDLGFVRDSKIDLWNSPLKAKEFDLTSP